MYKTPSLQNKNNKKKQKNKKSNTAQHSSTEKTRTDLDKTNPITTNANH